MLALIELQDFSVLPTDRDIHDGYVIAVDEDGQLKRVLYTKEHGWNTFKSAIPANDINPLERPFRYEGALTADQMRVIHAGWISFTTPCELDDQKADKPQAGVKEILDSLISMVETDFEMKLERYNRMDLFSSMNESGNELATELSDKKKLIDKLREAASLAGRDDE